MGQDKPFKFYCGRDLTEVSTEYHMKRRRFRTFIKDCIDSSSIVGEKEAERALELFARVATTCMWGRWVGTHNGHECRCPLGNISDMITCPRVFAAHPGLNLPGSVSTFPGVFDGRMGRLTGSPQGVIIIDED